MTENLRYPLTANSTAIGSKNDGTVFEFPTGSYVPGNTAYIMNGNTKVSNDKYFYSWHAATAGEGKENSIGVDIDGSICPAGWKLPYSYRHSSDKSHGGLLLSYGISPEYHSSNSEYTILQGFPMSISFSHYTWDGQETATTGGYLWSSTTSSTNSEFASFSLAFYTNYVSATNEYYKFEGLVIRCVAL